MKKIFFYLCLLVGLLAVKPVMAASPMLEFSPSSGSYTNGDTFVVKIKVNSGTEKSQGVDAWVTFDEDKLEVQSIETVSSPAFTFSLGKNIYNDSGKFDISCTSTDMSTYNATVLDGELVAVTFKAKATGTAEANFSCSTGSTIDSNIFNMSAVDVINCASNIDGSYTINSSSSTSSTATSTPTSTSTTDTSSDDDELPRTGGIGATVGLMIFGLMGVLSSLALRFL